MQIHELNTFSGTPGASDYLATDNGVDTSKISIKDITDPLNARIDNIIAGPAPSAEEVIDARLGVDGEVYPSLGDATRGQAADLKSDLQDIEDHVFKESLIQITSVNIPTTAGVTLDLTNTTFPVSIESGKTVAVIFESSSTLINKYAFYFNGTRLSTNLQQNTEYRFTTSEAITNFNIYTASSDVVGTGTLKATISMVAQNENSIEEQIEELRQDVDSLQILEGNDKWQLDLSSFTTQCVHHDNFSRTMTGYEIGMNAGGTDVGNSYDWVTPSSYDDGLRVDNGATFESGTRTYNHSLRKIAEQVSDNFMIEVNPPIVDYPVMLGFNVTDINNFQRLEIRKNTAGYKLILYNIVNGLQTTSIFNQQISYLVGKVISIYCIRGMMYFYLDDTLMFSYFVGKLGNYVYLASYRSYNAHFDFINVFNLVSKTVWNPNRILDTGTSDIPLKTVSANEGNYELQNVETRWSNYADHFTLHSDDELIHNGRRSEVSISNMDDYKGNLRHFVISFDVLFPSEYIDTQREDLFIQTHDRDGTYRGNVPFSLYIKNNVINVNTSSTHEPKADNTTVIRDLYRYDFAEVELGKWHHFDIEIKERYEENQNPFLRVKIDGKTEFEYRKANCYNDLLGTSPQYGIYKNNWGTGVTELQRYFDNFKIEYI